MSKIFIESERGGKLDPLPEEKPGQTVLSPDSYKRVYPDWKPSTTIDKTNVEETLEAIAKEGKCLFLKIFMSFSNFGSSRFQTTK